MYVFGVQTEGPKVKILLQIFVLEDPSGLGWPEALAIKLVSV